MNNALLRRIPKIDSLLALPEIRRACEEHPYVLVRELLKEETETLRQSLLAGTADAVPSAAALAAQVLERLRHGDYYSLRRVINATGVVLHTNLGRAPLGREAAEHVAAVAAGYSNLEYNLEKGERGSRYSHIERLLCEITGAEAAMVVNNNAGAVFLMLNTLCQGKTVAVSRGELVEIGGSFRVPEIMTRSGAALMEIGTTNKTHPYDYVNAIDSGAEALLKVHTSNFKIRGFTESVEIEELGPIAREKGALLLYDLGSGFLFPCEHFGLHGEGHVAGKCLRAGTDVVSFSGDKLLGSAQAGVLVGKKKYIDQIKKNHLTRMLRIDKLSLAALEYALRYSVDPALAAEHIPALHMLARTEDDCRAICRTLKENIRAAAPEIYADLVSVQDEAGGGSLPDVFLDGAALAIQVGALRPEQLEKKLRASAVPVIARISRDSLLLSARTLLEGDLDEIAAALARINQEAKA